MFNLCSTSTYVQPMLDVRSYKIQDSSNKTNFRVFAGIVFFSENYFSLGILKMMFF